MGRGSTVANLEPTSTPIHPAFLEGWELQGGAVLGSMTCRENPAGVYELYKAAKKGMQGLTYLRAWFGTAFTVRLLVGPLVQ